MNRYTLIGLVVGLVVGVFIGYEAGKTVSPPPQVMGGGMQGMPPPQMPSQPPPGGAAPDVQGRIAMNQALVARDPKNVQAWIQLGNDFFDTHQAQRSIDAYARALELRPNDPDVLTDQGVMYRALGQFDKAIGNFEQANRASPKHTQSLFNLGVVYANDLKQPAKAIEAWSRVIQIAPQSPQAAQARSGIEELKAQGAR